MAVCVYFVGDQKLCESRMPRVNVVGQGDGPRPAVFSSIETVSLSRSGDRAKRATEFGASTSAPSTPACLTQPSGSCASSTNRTGTAFSHRFSSARSSTGSSLVSRARLRHVAAPGGQAHRMARAVETLQRNFDQTLRIEEVARELGMSVSGFHAHFKAATALSPLQFQKQLRLQEAEG